MLLGFYTRAEDNLALQFEVAVNELRMIGFALQAYKADHDGNLPSRLTNLVHQGYLSADHLISVLDPYEGAQGGVPTAYALNNGNLFDEADEQGSSFMYEFNEAPCSWWHGMPDLRSWAEVKYYQMEHGDGINEGPYASNCFPVVRNFWFQYPNTSSHTNYTSGDHEPTVLNLAYDLKTVFASSRWWELDQITDETNKALTKLRGTHIRSSHGFGFKTINANIAVRAGEPFVFPLWPVAEDLSGYEYRLLTPAAFGQNEILGNINGNILYWNTFVHSPSNALFNVEISRDGIAITNTIYSVLVNDTHSLCIDGIHSITSTNVAIGWLAYTNVTYHIDTTTNLYFPWKLNVYMIEGPGYSVLVTNNIDSLPTQFFRIRASVKDD